MASTGDSTSSGWSVRNCIPAGSLSNDSNPTHGHHHAPDRKDEDFRTLRKGLGYCWSVVISAHPEAGKPVIKDLLGLDDPYVRWIMKENLKKNRLVRMDKQWTEGMLGSLGR